MTEKGKSGEAPKVAVITRTKNRPLFLERALRSVDSQTYTDYVHIVLNDGGDKRDVEKLLEKYKNKKRTVVHNKETVGLIRALNQAIKSVSSKYVTILDDDDTWPPERLEKTVSYLEETGDKAVVVKMDIIVEEIKDGKIRQVSQYLHPESAEGEINLFKQCYKNYISNGIVTYRREVYDELGGYDESLGTAEDWDFGIRLLMKHDVGFLRKEKPLFFYHQRPTQKGDQGNSVHAGVDQQEKTINLIRNRYLRQDLAEGRLGVGYIMNRYPEDEFWTARIEGHINHTANLLLEKLKNDRYMDKLNQALVYANTHPYRFALGRIYHRHIIRDEKKNDDKKQ
jgi:glycosyltransferase involved in cell wall biosynthesis